MSSGHVGCAGFAAPALAEDGGRRSREVPGCLTSESEERETWTAESLRAAFLNGKGFGSSRAVSGRGRDFGGLTFQVQHCDRFDESSPKWSEWDLVKRCDQPGKVLIQLESLILAQSERWRQA